MVIEQRHAGFQRVRHGHPIDLREDVAGQVRTEIERLKAGERIESRALGRIERSGDIGSHRRAEQMPEGARGKHGNGVEVALHSRE